MFNENPGFSLTQVLGLALLLLGNVAFYSKGVQYETLYRQTQAELLIVEKELAVYREVSNRD